MRRFRALQGPQVEVFRTEPLNRHPSRSLPRSPTLLNGQVHKTWRRPPKRPKPILASVRHIAAAILATEDRTNSTNFLLSPILGTRMLAGASASILQALPTAESLLGSPSTHMQLVRRSNRVITQSTSKPSTPNVTSFPTFGSFVAHESRCMKAIHLCFLAWRNIRVVFFWYMLSGYARSQRKVAGGSSVLSKES